MILEKQLLLPHQSGKGQKVISKLFGVHHSIKRKKYSQVENIQDSCQSSQELTSQQVHLKVRLLNAQPNCKTRRAQSQTLEALVSMLKGKHVKPYFWHIEITRDLQLESTIRKGQNVYGLFRRVAGESLSSLERTWQHSLGCKSCIKTSGTIPFDR